MRAKGDGGLIQRHDHPTCPPLIDGDRAKHSCRGRWVGTVDVELPNGRTQRKYLYGRTKAEAKAKLDKALRDKQAGTLVAKSPTVEAWMAEWLEMRKRPPKPIKPNTWNGYAEKVRNYLNPALGRKRLDQLKPAHVEAMYNDMRARGLSEATIRQAHGILKKALNDAVRKGRLGVTPMTRVDAPSTDTNKRQQFTLEEATRALAAAGDSARWWLALFYGMRQGEVLAMRWEYVDFQARTLTVEKSTQSDYGATAKNREDSPKSRASHRTLPMVGQIEARMILQWEAAGRPESGLVFPNSVGKLMDNKADWTAWRAFTEDAGLPPIALHAARNTAASLLEAAGLPDRMVAQILGHSKVTMTHRYTDADVERLRAILEKAVELVSPPHAIEGAGRSPAPEQGEPGSSPTP